ncbi:MAG: class I SAM-dependent methyltransferase [Acidobacteriota bacterium]|nr:MAG: class I SAM-dependent methyltransferase [Acidobacteriota bacterium]
MQEPSCDVEFFERAFRDAYARGPSVLREDFCGTAAICCEWVRSRRDRKAIGVDLDPEPLAWGREHNLAKLKPAQRRRVHLVQADARSSYDLPADVIATLNFSFFYFKQRSALAEYFRCARENLNDEGILVLDMVGGSEVLEEDREEITEHGRFDYVWEQHSFNPITADQVCFIHFRFPDGSELERAFEYRWRLWTLPEVRELLLESGFRRAEVYWEGTDEESDEGNGIFEPAAEAPSEPAWIAYVVAIK